jgi:stage II sporulation protein AA (anti-sigma F factor antagonist)
MKIDSDKDGARATISPSGLIDTRASQEFERHVVGLFNEGVRLVTVDLSKVDLITSAGIRVLVMMAQRLQRTGGGLVLCALSAQVRGVFDIAGLLGQFRIAATRDEAAAILAAVQSVPSGKSGSGTKLTRFLRQLLTEDDAAPSPRRAADTASGSRSRVASEILALMERTTAPGGDTPDPPRV